MSDDAKRIAQLVARDRHTLEFVMRYRISRDPKKVSDEYQKWLTKEIDELLNPPKTEIPADDEMRGCTGLMFAMLIGGVLWAIIIIIWIQLTK